MPSELNLAGPTPLSITALIINLGIGTVLSLTAYLHFEKFGSTLSNRSEFGKVLPFILLTTTLIITVVKSSLALSLGLVGALSIVRFRTPIKEPEELAYLFLVIAMGLGLGADQRLPTIIAGITILIVVALIKSFKGQEPNRNLYLSIDWKDTSNSENRLDAINNIILKHVKTDEFELRRFETRGQDLEASYFVNIPNVESLSSLVDELQNNFSNMGVTFIDQDQMPSL
jgi:uncharacterized membrane protein YhiD involved in acid resistance